MVMVRFLSEAVFVLRFVCDKVTVGISCNEVAHKNMSFRLEGIMVLFVITTTQCSPCGFQERGP